MLLSYLSQGSKLRCTGIREHNIELAFLPLDLCKEAIKIAEVRHVSLYSGDIFPDFLYRRRQLCIAAPAYVDVRAFVHKLLRRRKTDAAIAARDQCRFACKSHVRLFVSMWIIVIILFAELDASPYSRDTSISRFFWGTQWAIPRLKSRKLTSASLLLPQRG